MNTSFWITWGVILLLQNFSFTFVSRARNSASLSRHMKASLLSNGVWFVSQVFATDAIIKILSGQSGIGMAIFAALFYTVMTMSGSIVSHWVALRSEKGSAAVGSSKRYAQIPVAEYKQLKKLLKESN